MLNYTITEINNTELYYSILYRAIQLYYAIDILCYDILYYAIVYLFHLRPMGLNVLHNNQSHLP